MHFGHGRRFLFCGSVAALTCAAFLAEGADCAGID
jgi:hypothetical protein